VYQFDLEILNIYYSTLDCISRYSITTCVLDCNTSLAALKTIEYRGGHP
ncbi:2709_t:CDS:1, partial [Gigaspora rosea]